MQKTLILLSIFLVAIFVEQIWAAIQGRSIHTSGETCANVGVHIGNLVLKPITLVWQLLIFSQVQHYAFFHLEWTSATVWIAFFAVEASYYCYHRLSHEWPWLWAIHHTHHSSQNMNLSTAVRLNWLGSFIAPLFFLPLILLGIPTMLVIFWLAIGLLYQFFLHTQAFTRLPCIEGWLNTPSAHRVHHGSNHQYLDKNYGAILLIYDRLFGTYQPEKESVAYGVTTGPLPPNPLYIVFQPLFQLMQGKTILQKSQHAAKENINEKTKEPLVQPGIQTR